MDHSEPVHSGPSPPPRFARVPIIGLCGGIGSGKSEAAGILSELGAAVIDSDAVARRELESPDVRDILRAWWGPSILTESGVNRKRIAEIVFSDPAQKKRLEDLIHPRVTADRRRRVAELGVDPGLRAIVIDSPLLYETGLDRECDSVIFVEAWRAVRESRIARTRGWSPEELTRREKNQLDVQLKCSRADYTCSNNSDRETLRRQLQVIFNQILSKG